jgi:CHAD domain-containing protein
MPRTVPSELLVRQRLRALTRSLPAARQGNAKSLHHARVATRRLREALPLIGPDSRHRKLRRIARRLTRALGPVRELDVALQVLDGLESSRQVPAPAITRLRRVIAGERQRLHTEMVRQLDRCDLRKLGKRALAVACKHPAPAAGRRADPERISDGRRRAARRAERLRAAIENAAGLYLPDRLHEVRIAVKQLRYAMELVREVTGSRATVRIRQLKEAQDLLGRMHDLEVLIARTRGVQGSANAPDLKLSAHLDRLVRVLETECRQLHGHYMVLRKALLTICEQTISQAKRNTTRAA